MTTETHVAWLFELRIRDRRRPALDCLMRDMVDATQADEPGALDYEWYVSDDDARCHVFERFVDDAAALAHLQTFRDRFVARFFDALAPVCLTFYGAPGDAVRAALAALAPDLMTRVDGFSRRGASA